MRTNLFALILILTISLPTPQWASHDSFNQENLFHLTGEFFKEVGGIRTFRLFLSLEESEQKDKDVDLIFKAAGINRKEAFTAFECYLRTTDLINAGIKIKNAVSTTKEARDDGADLSSPAKVLVHVLEKRGGIVDLVQVTEALRQAEILFHMELKTRVAFKENGINIDLIKEEPAKRWGEKLTKEDLLPRKRDNR